MDFTENSKRITLFSGHYGSGKTNLAINYALSLKEKHENVAIADLDIVNPYYRTKDAQKILEEAGIRLIASSYADTNVDVPAIPSEAYALTADKTLRGIIDVGGDDRGALALGRYSKDIIAENDYEMFFVINKYRPLTRTAEDTIKIMREIEEAGRIKFTGIINNSNLGYETAISDVLASVDYANETADICNLELKYTCVLDRIYNDIKDKIQNVVPIKLYVKQSFIK